MNEKPNSFTGFELRQLMRRARRGTLATVLKDDGTPYGSLVNLATDQRGAPVLLLSSLAWHTRNLAADPRASIMVADPRHSGDALTGARLTVTGRFRDAGRPEAEARRYVALNPAAAQFAGFGDFSFWTFEPQLVHAIAGFGRIDTHDAASVFAESDLAAGFATLEMSAVEHMNADHGDAVAAYATGLLGLEAGPWRLVAADCDGVDLGLGERIERLDFDAPAGSPGELRGKLAALAKEARHKPLAD